MIVKKLHEAGVTSEDAYCAAVGSIGLSISSRLRCAAAGRNHPHTAGVIMIVKKLHEAGVTSEHAYCAAVGSIGLSIASWVTSHRSESTERADRWGIFVGEWAPP